MGEVPDGRTSAAGVARENTFRTPGVRHDDDRCRGRFARFVRAAIRLPVDAQCRGPGSRRDALPRLGRTGDRAVSSPGDVLGLTVWSGYGSIWRSMGNQLWERS